MPIPNGTEDDPRGRIPGRPGEEVGDEAGAFAIQIAAAIIFVFAAGIVIVGACLVIADLLRH